MADDFGGGLFDNIFGGFSPPDVAGNDPTGAGGLYTTPDVPLPPSRPTAQSDPEAPMLPPQASPLSGDAPPQRPPQPGMPAGQPMPPQQGGGFMGAIGNLFGGGDKQSGHGLFGSDLILPGVLGRPKYDTDPNASPSKQATSLLEQQMQRAGKVANSPFVQLFNPDEAKRARDFITEAPAKLAAMKGLEQKQTDQMQQARNFGVPESSINPYITNDTIDNHLLAQYRSGDINAMKQLQARGKGEWVTSFQAEAVDAYQTKAGVASSAIGKLRNATDSPAMYSAAVNALPDDERKALTGFIQEAGGNGIPKTPGEFKQLQAQHGAKFMQMQQTLATMQQKTRTMQDFATPMAKEAADQYGGNFRIPGTQENIGLPVFTRAMDGQPGAIAPDGSAREELFGKKGGANFLSPERKKTIRENFEDNNVKGVVGTYTTANKFHHIVNDPDIFRSAAGLALVNDGFGGEARNVAEGARAAGNIGLTRMLEAQQGYFDHARQAIARETGAMKTWLDNGQKGAQPEMRVTQEYINGMKHVAEIERQYAIDQVQQRVSGAVRYAGSVGMQLEDLPLDDDLKKIVAPVHEEARLNTVNGLRAMPRIVRGDQSIYFPQGSMVPGAEQPRKDIPAPPTGQAAQQQDASPSTQAAVAARPPGQQVRQDEGPPTSPPGRVLTTVNVQPGGTFAPVPGAPSAGGPGPTLPTPQTGMMSQTGAQPSAPAPMPGGRAPLATGPQPASIGGQNVAVNVPPGASSQYVARMQGIESGAERSPWTATTKKSTASGAFQFLDDTWASNKPPGAPARAKDATPQQQVQALENFTAKNAAALGARGLPVNDASLYMAHNLGVGGAEKLMKADPNADAAKVVGAQAAKNNPAFFSGGATVAQALQRYQAKMGAGGGGVALPSGVSPGERPAFGQRGAVMPDMATGEEGRGLAPIPGWASGRREQALENNKGLPSTETVAGFAPAAASTAGAVVGGIGGAAVGGPVGALAGGMAGGGIGGGLGQALKDRMLGNEQSAARIAKEVALGTVLGVVPEGRPVVGAVARMAGVGAVEGGEAAIEGKKPSEIAESAVKGVGGALAGEAVGRALGMAGHKIFSNFTDTAQQGLIKAGTTVSEGRKALETMNPKLPTGGTNPAYEKLTNDVKQAETKIKEAGLDVDNFAYATEQVKSGTSKGEAKVMQTAQSEQQRLGEQYNELHSRAGEAPGAVKANIPIEDGPMSKLRTAENPTGKVDARYADEAKNAEMLIRAPAPNWEAKSRQLQQAGSELLAKGRVYAANNDEVGEKAMRELFNGVREQQIKMANAIMKPGEASKFVTDLKRTDKAYARLMDATEGMNYQKMQAAMAQGNTPNARKIEAAFSDLAAGDKDAMRVFNAMKASARGEYVASHKLMGPIMKSVHGALHYMPLGLDKIARAMDAYAHFRMLGRQVKMGDIIANIEGNAMQQAGAAGSRAVGM
jgi:hypothetical protein